MLSAAGPMSSSVQFYRGYTGTDGVVLDMVLQNQTWGKIDAIRIFCYYYSVLEPVHGKDGLTKW